MFEETGAIVAAPTFSLPEHLSGQRNWDYRFTWVRDTSFTLYALIRLGFTEEANNYMDFILARLKDRNSDGSLQIVYTIHGGKDLQELELTHLEGHKGSKPVRIGNGAADHLQLVSVERVRVRGCGRVCGRADALTDPLAQDIYGELMDCIYLAQKYSKPLVSDITRSANLKATVLGLVGCDPSSGRLCLHSARHPRPVHLGSPGSEEELPLFKSHALGGCRPRAPSRRQTMSPMSQPNEVA